VQGRGEAEIFNGKSYIPILRCLSHSWSAVNPNPRTDYSQGQLQPRYGYPRPQYASRTIAQYYYIVAIENLEPAVNNQTDDATQRHDNPDAAPSPINITKPINAETTQPATQKQLDDVEKQMSGFEKATLRWAQSAVLLSALAAIFI
jgi:hypothetical protein